MAPMSYRQPVLDYLAAQTEPVTCRQIAEAVGSSQTVITSHLIKLHADGLVTKQMRPRTPGGAYLYDLVRS